MAYVNLPGTFPKLIDGNLSFSNTNSDPVVLVIGTAETGFTSELYQVSNVRTALSEFGASSEIAKGIIEARDGGATNIVALRLPGEAPVLARVGSERSGVSAAGFTITPRLASDEAGAKYGVAFRHTKMTGTALQAANARERVDELMVVDNDTQELVYHYTLADGVIVDLGLVDVTVSATDAGLSTGIEAITVAFANNATATGTITCQVSGVDVEVAVTSGDTPTEIGDAFVTAFDLTSLSTSFTASNSSGTVTITANGDTDSSGDLVYGSAHPWAGYTARPAWTAATVIVSVTGTTVTESLGSNHGRAMDVGLFPVDSDMVFSADLGGIFVPLEDVFAGATYTDTDIDTYVWPGLTTLTTAGGGTVHSSAGFTAGDNGATLSYMKRYEKLNDIFGVLDLKNFDLVVPQGVKLDVPSLADMDSDDVTDLGLASVTDYPSSGSATNILGKVAIVDNGDYTNTYYWDVDNDGVAEICSDPNLTASDYTGSFYEVNFAHQLAKFCYQASEDYQFCHGVIGTGLPSSLAAKSVLQYFGRVPTYTFDKGLNADIIRTSGDNGTGLLGHKLVGGNSNYNSGLKNGGLYVTTDGYMRSSYGDAILVKDVNGRPVDLGKYISVVAAFGHLRNEYNDRVGGYLTNIANSYAGLISRLPSNVSTTAQSMRNVAMRYSMLARVADDAAGAKLVVLIDNDGVKVADGPTFASHASDYKRLTTMRIVGKIVEEIRIAMSSFYGRGQSTNLLLAQNTAIEQVITKNIKDDKTLTGGTYTFPPVTKAERVLGKRTLNLRLSPVFELRQVNLNIALDAGN